jgi:hypothetical protein
MRQFLLRQAAKLPKGFISWHAPLVIKGILNKPDLIPYEDIELWPGVTLKKGIPYVSYSDGSSGFNPTTIAQYGLMASTKQDEKSLKIVQKVANWLVEHQSSDGSWVYDFRYENPDLDLKLNPGWKSAIAQGNAISLLVRAFNLFRDQRYLDAAYNAVPVLFVPVESGGLQRPIDGMMFFEEYPDPNKGIYVLNGHLYTVIALYELAKVNDDKKIKDLAFQSARTGAAILERYTIPGTFYSKYALAGRTIIVSRRYQECHVRLCVLLCSHSGIQEYAKMAFLWSLDWRMLLPSSVISKIRATYKFGSIILHKII